jgi:hypothetical protein
MKKLALALFLLASTASQSVFAQEGSAFNAGDLGLNVGLGFVSREGVSGVNTMPALAVSADYGIVQLGPGVLAGGGMLGWQYAFSDGFKSNYLVVGPRISYHLGGLLPNGRLNLYAATHLGYEMASVTTDLPFFGETTTTGSDFYYGLVVGGQYFFKPKFGVFLESGYDYVWLKTGVSFKF